MHIISHGDESGPGRVLANIANNLSGDHLQLVVLLRQKGVTAELEDFAQKRGKLLSLAAGRLSLRQTRRLLKDVVADFRPDIVHTHGIIPDALAVSLRRKIRAHVNTIHNFPWEDYPLLYGKRKGNIMARLHLLLIRRIRTPVACSVSLQKRFMESGVPVQAIPNGVQVHQEKARLSKEMLTELRAEFGIPENRRVYLCLGPLIPRKQTLQAVRAFAQGAGKDDILLIGGSGPEKPILEKAAKESGMDVRLMGFIPELDKLWPVVDVYVSLSLSEGLPMAALDALSHGVPLILSRIPAHEELLSRHPGAGILIEPDRNSAALAMSLASDMDLEEASKAAYTAAVECFSASHMASEYESLYRSLVAPIP